MMTTSGLVWTASWMSGTILDGSPCASMTVIVQPFFLATACMAASCSASFTLDCDQET